MLTSILYVYFLILTVFTCEYKPPDDEDVNYAITEYPETHRTKRQVKIWDWIRIETLYDSSFNALTEEKKETLEDLITSARDYFESTLKVQRLSSIQLAPFCKGGGGYFPNGTFLCYQDCQKRCGLAIAPEDAHYFANCVCKDGCLQKQKNWGGKLKTADFVLFVSVLPTSCGSTTLAFANYCSLDRSTNRPVAAFVNICPHPFNNMHANEVSSWLATVKHELIHAFVFSPALFRKFDDKKQVLKAHKVDIIPGVVERFTRDNWETANGTISHDVYMIVTPKVRMEARNHFKCPDLEGAELESQGGAGTLGAHWEKRVFENEAMTGVSTQILAITRVTLALFEDSGWYKVNYNKSEPMLWGHNLGCTFVKKSCLTWMKANSENPYPFCKTFDDIRCSADRLNKVRCNLIKSGLSIPAEYNYSIPNLYKDTKGRVVYGHGNVEVADFCPYYRIYTGSSDHSSDTRCTFSGNMNYNNYSLEVFSPTSRCFQLDGGIRVKSEIGTTMWFQEVGCYETVCKDNRLYIKTQNSKFYPCFRGGQFIHIEKRVHGVGTVTTRIICPSCPEFCGIQFCAPDKQTRERVGDPTRAATCPRVKSIAMTFFVVFLLTFDFSLL